MDLTPDPRFLDRLSRSPIAPWRDGLVECVQKRLASAPHGDLPRWRQALRDLPALPQCTPRLAEPCIGCDQPDIVEPVQQRRLVEVLERLHPWRKGPYCLYGVHVDAEWRSDLKWARLECAITPLQDRLVLDVGCGNGYHAWRMLGAGARLVIGIDPGLLYVTQWLAVNRYLDQEAIGVLPLRLEDVPPELTGFDTVFSMGVLSHRRSPTQHLRRLRELLRPGGELILETLVVDRAGDQVLMPAGRYAAMRNVWCIPTPDRLRAWLDQCGFVATRVVDVSPTGVEEQRATPWMRFQSLADHLDPTDRRLTIEGYPAPTRALLITQRPA